MFDLSKKPWNVKGNVALCLLCAYFSVLHTVRNQNGKRCSTRLPSGSECIFKLYILEELLLPLLLSSFFSSSSTFPKTFLANCFHLSDLEYEGLRPPPASGSLSLLSASAEAPLRPPVFNGDECLLDEHAELWLRRSAVDECLRLKNAKAADVLRSRLLLPGLEPAIRGRP